MYVFLYVGLCTLDGTQINSKSKIPIARDKEIVIAGRGWFYWMCESTDCPLDLCLSLTMQGGWLVACIYWYERAGKKMHMIVGTLDTKRQQSSAAQMQMLLAECWWFWWSFFCGYWFLVRMGIFIQFVC